MSGILRQRHSSQERDENDVDEQRDLPRGEGGKPVAGRSVDRAGRLRAGRGLPREQYLRELAARLQRVVDCDVTYWHTLDPAMRLMTSDARRSSSTAPLHTVQDHIKSLFEKANVGSRRESGRAALLMTTAPESSSRRR